MNYTGIKVKVHVWEKNARIGWGYHYYYQNRSGVLMHCVDLFDWSDSPLPDGKYELIPQNNSEQLIVITKKVM